MDATAIVPVERRYAVLEFRQLVGDVRRQQIAPGRQGLAEFDEDRPQLLERQAQPLAAGDADAALEPGPGREIARESETAGTDASRARSRRARA